MVRKAAFAMICPASAAAVAAEVRTDKDIRTLASAGLPAAVVVAGINASRTDFDTSVEEFVALPDAGADES